MRFGRSKRTRAGFGYYLLAALFVLFVVGLIIGWFVDLPGARKTAHAGEPCGPGYRWTRVGSAIDPDLSCEKE